MSYSPPSVLTCFENLIGIRGQCATVTSPYGYYANDIDISSDFINEILTREYNGVTDFHTKKLNFAVKRVIGDIKKYLQPHFRVNTFIEDGRLGIFQDNLTLIAGDGTLKGININLGACQSYLDLH